MIYLVTRTDDVCYDETESVVVEADSEGHAREVAKSVGGDQSRAVWETAKVTRLGTADPGTGRGVILHTSFCAG